MQDNILLTQKFLLNRLRNDATTFYGHNNEFQTVRQLISRTVEYGESNSALIIGPSRSGKSTLLASALYSLHADQTFVKNSLIVRLDGTLDTDDGIALKTATTQMKLDNAVDGRVFGTYAENLSFLLACLKSGNKDKSKAVIFVLDHFDLFCAHPKQSLLYNLFDIVQSSQAPICVIGLTCRNDVLELLEKRVKSRFSHRQISLFPGDVLFADRIRLYTELMTLPSRKELEKIQRESLARRDYDGRHFDVTPFVGKFKDSWLKTWNNHVEQLFQDNKVQASLEYMFDYDATLELTKQLFAQLIARLAGASSEFVRADDLIRLCATYEIDDKAQMYSDISVLEICLLIAIKHHTEIYDRDPFNFEMILTRYRKFENSSTQSRMENVERAIALKSFEHLNMLEIFVPISTAAAKVQKEFQMHKLSLTSGQIKRIVSNFPNLPTDISQWALSSLV